MEIAIESFKIKSQYDQLLYQEWCLVIQVNNDHAHRNSMNSKQVLVLFFTSLILNFHVP